MDPNEFLDEKQPVYYSASKWVDHIDYFTYDEINEEITVGAKQSKKCRITGSIVNKCINPFSDKILVARQIAGIYREELSPDNLMRINYGKEHEKDAREWYCSQTGYSIKKSVFAVYKKDYRLGAEHDGFVCSKDGTELDGIIEIKCPMKVYESLINHINRGAPGDEISFISESHYDQMQMEMEIFNKSWCDYIIYCIPENFVYTKRVYRDLYYWKVMYEKIIMFIDAKLSPILKEMQSDYPYNPLADLELISKHKKLL